MVDALKRIGRTIQPRRFRYLNSAVTSRLSAGYASSIPLTRFRPTAIGGFDPQRVSALVLSQGAAVDGKAHELVLDDFGSSLTRADVRADCAGGLDRDRI